MVSSSRALPWGGTLVVALCLAACDLGSAPGLRTDTDSGADASRGTDASGRRGSGGTAPMNGGSSNGGAGGTGGTPANGDAGGGGGPQSDAGSKGGADASSGDAGQDAGDGGSDAATNDGTAIGTIGAACSPEGATGCAGHAQTRQLKCQGGIWQSAGSCPSNTYCASTPPQYAGECRPIVTECVGLTPGTPVCRGARPDQCGVDLVNTDDPNTSYVQCKLGCTGGRCVGRSCGGLAVNCGKLSSESCCAASVATGGPFYRRYDDVENRDIGFPASVSDFALDRYEVTVGRFRKFVAGWVAGYRPMAGEGKHSHLNGGSGLVASSGGNETGWDVAWAAKLATTSAGWDTNLACDAAHQTWTSAAGANENRPINCVTWYEMYAFAIWDFGFLPSAAEWNYAAAGGSLQRARPWSEPATSTTIDCSHANYRGAAANNYCVSPGTSGAASNVGTFSSTGDGIYGQADLAGNEAEWVLDVYAFRPHVPCEDCVDTGTGDRAVAGGSFTDLDSALFASSLEGLAPDTRSPFVGGRVGNAP